LTLKTLPDQKQTAIAVAGSATDAPRPQLGLSPDRVDFGQVEVGRAQARDVLLVNNGREPLKLAFESEDNEAFGAGSTCASQVAAGQRCVLQVTFAPKVEGETRSAVRISDATGRLNELPVSGSGEVLAKASLRIDRTPRWVFPNEPLRAHSAAQRATVINNGNVALNLGRLQLSSNTRAFAITSDGCSTRKLQPNGRCEIQVTFAPDARGVENAMLTMLSDPEVRTPVHVSLSGRGLTPAHLDAPNAIEFPYTVADNKTEQLQRLMLTNSGDGDVGRLTFDIDNATRSDFHVSGCDAGIPANSTCTAIVSFRRSSKSLRQSLLRINGAFDDNPLPVTLLADPAPKSPPWTSRVPPIHIQLPFPIGGGPTSVDPIPRRGGGSMKGSVTGPQQPQRPTQQTPRTGGGRPTVTGGANGGGGRAGGGVTGNSRGTQPAANPNITNPGVVTGPSVVGSVSPGVRQSGDGTGTVVRQGGTAQGTSRPPSVTATALGVMPTGHATVQAAPATGSVIGSVLLLQGGQTSVSGRFGPGTGTQSTAANGARLNKNIARAPNVNPVPPPPHNATSRKAVARKPNQPPPPR
jgi:hypothetical protein